MNNKIKVAIRQGYGFRNIDNLIALVMLRCSDLSRLSPGGRRRDPYPHELTKPLRFSTAAFQHLNS